MAQLNSKFDILRGWPNKTSLCEDYDVGATENNPHKAGTWLALDASKPTVSTSADSNPDSGRGTPLSLIIEGYEDFSARAVGRTTNVLAGATVVRLTNGDGYDMFWAAVDGNGNGTADDDITGDYVPGIPVKVEDGKIAPAFRKVTAGAGAGLIGGGAPADITAAGALIDADFADDADTAMNLLVLNSESAIVGHVIRYDSTDNVLEVFIN